MRATLQATVGSDDSLDHLALPVVLKPQMADGRSVCN